MLFGIRNPSCPLLALIIASSIAHAADQPPKLRLPDSVAPTSYRVALKLDPDQTTFNGQIAIQIDIKSPQDLIWLNAKNITVADAKLMARGKTLQAQTIPGGDDFLGLRSTQLSRPEQPR